MKGGRYAPGYNVDCGDNWLPVFFKWLEYDQLQVEGPNSIEKYLASYLA